MSTSRRARAAGAPSRPPPKPLRLPKHSGPFRTSAQVLKGQYRYIHDAEFGPHINRNYSSNFHPKLPWRASSSVTRSFSLSAPRIVFTPSATKTTSSKDASAVPWRAPNPPKSGRNGDFTPIAYMSDLEMDLYMKRHENDKLRRVIFGHKPSPETKSPAAARDDKLPIAGPWFPTRGKVALPDCLFTPSWPSDSNDVMPPNNYELMVLAQKHPPYSNPRLFKFAGGSRWIDDPMMIYARLPGPYHIQPRVLRREHARSESDASLPG